MFLGWSRLVVEVGKKLVEAEILCWWRLGGWWRLMPKKRVEAVEEGKKLVEAERQFSIAKSSGQPPPPFAKLIAKINDILYFETRQFKTPVLKHKC